MIEKRTVALQDEASADDLLSGLSLVVPVYNSSEVLPVLIERVRAIVETYKMPVEVILVDDGSRDRSWDVVQDLTRRYQWVRGYHLMRNYGQHNALLCGIRAARFDTIVTMDDDLQHSPGEILRLVGRLNEGFDVVYGTPEAEQNGFMRAIASRITRFALRTAIGADVAKNVSAFRVFRTQLREGFADYQTPFVSIDVLLTWGTTRFAAVTVPFNPRYSGTSNYSFTKLLRHALDMMTGFSTAPLQMASVVGFGCMLFGAAVLFFVFGRYLLEGSVPGFPFLASIVSIFSGAQLFALGVIGEYLARMHFRTMNRPTYVVRAISGEMS